MSPFHNRTDHWWISPGWSGVWRSKLLNHLEHVWANANYTRLWPFWYVIAASDCVGWHSLLLLEKAETAAMKYRSTMYWSTMPLFEKWKYDRALNNMMVVCVAMPIYSIKIWGKKQNQSIHMCGCFRWEWIGGVLFGFSYELLEFRFNIKPNQSINRLHLTHR